MATRSAPPRRKPAPVPAERRRKPAAASPGRVAAGSGARGNGATAAVATDRTLADPSPAAPGPTRSWRALAAREAELDAWGANGAPNGEPPPSASGSAFDILFRQAGALLRGGFGLLEAGLSSPILDEIDAEVRERIARSPMELNSYGFDPWGFNADTARKALIFSTLLYRYYFRTETFGIENVPSGRVLLISNHAGQVAIDAVMIGTACLMEGDPPRIVRGMGEYWLPTLPVFNVLMTRVGSVVGTPKNCVDLLEHGEAVVAFPEGVRGMNKAWSERYRLQQFGLGFLRLALQTNTPIVPIAVVGSEEQAPSLGNFKPLARLLGMPAFPMVLTPVPLPVRYRIHFGKPMEFGGNANDEDEVIGRKVEQVKTRIREMLERGLRERRGVFR